MKNFGIILAISAVIILSLQACEKNEENSLLELSSNVYKGQDGFEYVLTKNEFLTPYDLPVGELRKKYGKESGIADWNDLTTNLEVDLSEFLRQIGLPEIEDHESFFITKDGEYEHTTYRYYMLTGKSNSYSSAWIILKNLDDSRLILSAGYDKGKILVKIPADQ